MNFRKAFLGGLLLCVFFFAPMAIVHAQSNDLTTHSTSSGQDATSMVSSWYNAKHSYDVANNRFPKGTIFLITNPQNGKMSVGMVAGTGPFIKGRQLDVSAAIASTLGFKGQGVASLLVQPIYIPTGDDS